MSASMILPNVHPMIELFFDHAVSRATLFLPEGKFRGLLVTVVERIFVFLRKSLKLEIFSSLFYQLSQISVELQYCVECS